MSATDSPTRYARTNDGTYVAYQVTGAGPIDVMPIIGHGISVEDQMEGAACREFIERLQRFARVIRFDRRGSGLSDPLPSFDESTWEHWVDDATAVLTAAGCAEAAVIGTDGTSSVTSLMLAAVSPLVTRLVAFNPAARFVVDDDYPWGWTLDEAEAMLQQGFEDHLANAVSPESWIVRGLDPATRRWFLTARRRGLSPSTLRALYRNGMLADFRAVLPTIRVPTLVLSSRDLDPRLSARSRHVADSIPGARLVEVPGAAPLAYLGPADAVLDEIEHFLTGVRPQRVDDRVLATVLFTDLVDSTALASRLGDRAWKERLDRHDEMVRAHLARFRGREVKTLGDGFLAVFDGPARAVRCAMAIVEDGERLDLAVRAGLHTGEIELRRDDVVGVAVNVGARVAACASGGEVLVSRTVVDLVAGSGLVFTDRGDHRLKGFADSWRLFGVARS